MNYTQLELTFNDEREVLWFPVAEGVIRVGMIIARKRENTIQNWIVTQVCVTLPDGGVPEQAIIVMRHDLYITPTEHTVEMYG